MKKLWLAMVLALALVCWGGSAGAIRIVGASNCIKCLYQTMFVENLGEYHHVECHNLNCAYEADLKHSVECEDMTKCIVCGNTTNLSNAEIRHIKTCTYYRGKYGEILADISYTFDEYKHRVECFCGEKVWEDYHEANCYSSKPGTCYECDVENAIILEENLKHYVFLEDDDGLVKCSYCDYVKTEAVRLPGDADNNSSVTIDDAIAILSGSVSSDSNADVNGDGNVDQQDVLRIMQYLAGWGVTLQ